MFLIECGFYEVSTSPRVAKGQDPYAGKMKADPHAGVEWSRGIVDMAQAIQENRPQRLTGAHTAHVVDIVCGIQTAFREGRRVESPRSFYRRHP